MSRIRNERALPFLGASQPIEHFVEGDGEGADLVCSRWHRQPFTTAGWIAEPALSADLLGAGAQLLHRSQCPANYSPRDGGESPQQQRKCDEQRVPERRTGSDYVAIRQADDHTDTVMLCQGERAILETTFRYPGEFMFHAHQSEFAELGWMGLFRAEEADLSDFGANIPNCQLNAALLSAAAEHPRLEWLATSAVLNITPAEGYLTLDLAEGGQLRATLLATMQAVPQQFLALLNAAPQNFMYLLAAREEELKKGK